MQAPRQGRGAIPKRASHEEIRRNNLELVLRHLATLGPASRAAIAQRAGLARATVSRLVAELLELHLVREVAPVATSRTGRPGTKLELDGDYLLAVGAELNVESMTVVITDIAGRVLKEERRALDATALGPLVATEELAAVCKRCVGALQRHPDSAMRPVAGIGVAVPALVDATLGVVTDAPNLHWRDFPLVAELRRHLDWPPMPVEVGNDANFAAQAEYWVGPHAGEPNLVYVAGDIGIGGGLIVEDRLLLGPRGHAGEVGHMTVDPAGPLCGCGRRGCWESLIGLGAFLASVGTPVPRGARPEAAVGAVAERALAGDPGVAAALERLGYWIGIGTANLVNLLGTEVVVLGGYFHQLRDWILPNARSTLEAQVMSTDAKGCRLVTSTLGFRAAAIGGALQAVDQVLRNPIALHEEQVDPAAS